MTAPTQPPSNDPQAFPIGRVLGINLLVLAVVQGAIFLLGPLSGGESYLIIPIGSLLYLGAHCLVLGSLMLVQYTRGNSTGGTTYLATMGIILLIGGGACFIGGGL